MVVVGKNRHLTELDARVILRARPRMPRIVVLVGVEGLSRCRP